MVKQRSNSYILNQVAEMVWEKVGRLANVSVTYIRSEDNPADGPSRMAQRSQLPSVWGGASESRERCWIPQSDHPAYANFGALPPYASTNTIIQAKG
jgi:hypothetical protein